MMFARRLLRIAYALTAAGIAVGPALGDTPLRAGLWEVRVETEMEGVPMALPTMTRKTCVTEKDLVPHTPQQGEDCKVLEQEMQGNTVTWRIRCRQSEGTTEGSGRIVYQGDRYRGTLDIRMAGGQMDGMRMRQKISGRRLGACQ